MDMGAEGNPDIYDKPYQSNRGIAVGEVTLRR
jgi:hypothetical protein